jgi:hypothetical protein
MNNKQTTIDELWRSFIAGAIALGAVMLGAMIYMVL